MVPSVPCLNCAISIVVSPCNPTRLPTSRAAISPKQRPNVQRTRNEADTQTRECCAVIQIGFNQNMQFTGVGTIHIRSGSASGSIATSFTCGVSTEAVIVNNVLTINPKDDLATGTVFYVTLPSAGIANTVGSFIDPITSYNFNTEFTPFNFHGGDYEQILVFYTSTTC